MANAQSEWKKPNIDPDLKPYRDLFVSLVEQSVRDARLHPERSKKGLTSDDFYREIADLFANMLKHEPLTRLVLPRMLQALEIAAGLRKKRVTS